MNSIYLYNGPDEDFENFIKENYLEENSIARRLYFRDVIQSIDQINLETIMEEMKKENKEYEVILVIKTEDFFSIKDHFTEKLMDRINSWIEKNYIITAVIQNPPKVFLNKLNKLESENKIELIKDKFELKSITKENLKEIVIKIKQRIIGQDQIIKQIVASLYLSANSKKNKPVVLMFYGPPGVGKTETVNIISEVINNTKAFRQQLSMFKTKEFSDYMFGSEIHSKALSKDLIRNNSNVILLDEFNQCPEYIYSSFFQMFDEGYFEDFNYKVDLTNSIIICTANFDSLQEIQDRIGPALYSRFNHFIQFNDLNIKDKETLIYLKYNEIIQDFSEQEKEFIEKQNLLSNLILMADKFSDVRNIHNGLRMFLSKVLAEELIIETLGLNKDEKEAN
ncbi:AAA family ATPase [Lysinibacillus sp. 3P01SB]|uniref:AAA family ATPase n=1 Tax=Lysinibacillus sp. 3P01SB TaxID=3132284 RepID=UPI0039A4E3EC